MLAKVAEMPGSDRAIAKRLHAIVTKTAPALWPKTWYGMPAYARDDKVVCFFQSRGQVQVEVRDLRLQRQREPRQRRHVADRLCAEAVDRRRRGEDRRARQESGELRTRPSGSLWCDETPAPAAYSLRHPSSGGSLDETPASSHCRRAHRRRARRRRRASRPRRRAGCRSRGGLDHGRRRRLRRRGAERGQDVLRRRDPSADRPGGRCGERRRDAQDPERASSGGRARARHAVGQRLSRTRTRPEP